MGRKQTKRRLFGEPSSAPKNATSDPQRDSSVDLSAGTGLNAVLEDTIVVFAVGQVGNATEQAELRVSCQSPPRSRATYAGTLDGT